MRNFGVPSAAGSNRYPLASKLPLNPLGVCSVPSGFNIPAKPIFVFDCGGAVGLDTSFCAATLLAILKCKNNDDVIKKQSRNKKCICLLIVFHQERLMAVVVVYLNVLIRQYAMTIFYGRMIIGIAGAIA